MYSCAQSVQRQHESRKVLDISKQRDKIPMHSFDCKGWLQIHLSRDLQYACVKLVHEEDHVHYCMIDIPNDVKDYVKESADKLTVTQVRSL